MALLLASAIFAFVMGEQGVPCKTLKEGDEVGQSFTPVSTNRLLRATPSLIGSDSSAQLLNSHQYQKRGDATIVGHVFLSRRELPEYQPGKEYGSGDICQNVYMDLDYACGVMSCLAVVLWGLDFMYIMRAILHKRRLRKKDRVAEDFHAGDNLEPRPYQSSVLSNVSRGHSISSHSGDPRYRNQGEDEDDEDDDGGVDDYQDTMDGRRMRSLSHDWAERSGQRAASRSRQTQQHHTMEQQCTIPLSMRTGCFGETEYTLQQKTRWQTGSTNDVPASDSVLFAPPSAQPNLAAVDGEDAALAAEQHSRSCSRSRSRGRHHHSHPHDRPHTCSRSRSRPSRQRDPSVESIPHTESTAVSSSALDLTHLVPSVPPEITEASPPQGPTEPCDACDLELACGGNNGDDIHNGVPDNRPLPCVDDYDQDHSYNDNPHGHSNSISSSSKTRDNNGSTVGYVHYPAGPACYAFDSAGGDFQQTFVNMAARLEQRHSPSYGSGQSTPRGRSQSPSRNRTPISPSPIPTTPTAAAPRRNRVILTGLDIEDPDANVTNPPVPEPSAPTLDSTLNTANGDGENQGSSAVATESQPPPTSTISPAHQQQVATEDDSGQQVLDRIKNEPYDYVVCRTLPSGLRLNTRSRSNAQLTSNTGSPTTATATTTTDNTAADNTATNTSPKRSLSARRAQASGGSFSSTSSPPLTIDTNVRPSIPRQQSSSRSARHGPLSSASITTPVSAKSQPHSAVDRIGGSPTTATPPVSALDGNGRSPQPSSSLRSASRTSLNSLQYRGDF
ncbi:hypothetical protein BGW41_005885 [Actinomortierella wolfii]|nr:hypothetical protein BGW41_005885 [Actinomortierella wolfii]